MRYRIASLQEISATGCDRQAAEYIECAEAVVKRSVTTADDRPRMTDPGVSRTCIACVLGEQLVRQLAQRARAEGLKLTGEGGLLARLTKVVVESALEGEMDDHLGYGKHDPVGRNGGNSRNGVRPKTGFP
jgi:Transposase, Mutator family